LVAVWIDRSNDHDGRLSLTRRLAFQGHARECDDGRGPWPRRGAGRVLHGNADRSARSCCCYASYWCWTSLAPCAWSRLLLPICAPVRHASYCIFFSRATARLRRTARGRMHPTRQSLPPPANTDMGRIAQLRPVSNGFFYSLTIFSSWITG
jgi:hypothetical protein